MASECRSFWSDAHHIHICPSSQLLDLAKVIPVVSTGRIWRVTAQLRNQALQRTSILKCLCIWGSLEVIQTNEPSLCMVPISSYTFRKGLLSYFQQLHSFQAQYPLNSTGKIFGEDQTPALLKTRVGAGGGFGLSSLLLTPCTPPFSDTDAFCILTC